MSKNLRYYDENGQPVFEGDALDSRGLLKDGHRVSIPTFMRDSETVEDGRITLEDAVATLDYVSLDDRKSILQDIGRQAGRTSGYQIENGLHSTTVDARDAATNDLSNTWRTIDGCPGDSCTTSGGKPGKLCTQDGKLTCIPLSTKSSKKSNREWEIAGPLSDSARAMADAARSECIHRMTNAWKRK